MAIAGIVSTLSGGSFRLISRDGLNHEENVTMRLKRYTTIQISAGQQKVVRSSTHGISCYIEEEQDEEECMG